MTLYIRNMVCDRCISTVQRILSGLALPVTEVGLGYAEIASVAEFDQQAVEGALRGEGFSLIEDRKAVLVQKTKALLIDLVRNKGLASVTENISVYLSKKIGKDYHYLTTLFSQLENITIERFIILQKIERAKELLTYGEHTVTEIAHQLGYSNVAYLSNQFKQVTGYTPGAFKKLKHHDRKTLDRLY